MGHSHGQHWNEAKVLAELRPHVERLGRMPSMPELRLAGRNDLAIATIRWVGLARARQLLGVEEKDSCTARGRRWETYVEGVLESFGYSVTRQTTKSPFDLLVNGRVRVNVKSASSRAYKMKTSGTCSGHFFGIGHTWKHCDVFALVRVDGTETPTILWVRADELKQQTLTLTKNHPFHQRTSSRDVLG